MKILYLTPNFINYSAAYYQYDLIYSLQNKIEVILWGPGYKNFDHTLSLENIFNKFNLTEKDILIVGHGWLSDIPVNYNSKQRYSWNKSLNEDIIDNLEYCGVYNFSAHKGKKICILNKEYVSLSAKLQFIKKGKFDLALSHYSNCEEFEKDTDTRFIFFPCSVDYKKFQNKINYSDHINKKYDLCFSGLLQNPYIKSLNNELFSLRKKIQSKLFYEIFQIPFINKYQNKRSIFWNAYSDNSKLNKLLQILGKYKKLTFQEYLNMFRESKATLNTLSPYNLIGPRYFESMISGSVNFCQKSEYYSKIFREFEHFVPFKSDLSDFKEMFNFATSDSKDIKKIIEASYTLVVENHTYDIRAKNIIMYARKLINNN